MNKKLYCAVLERDCEPHYFENFENARDYISKGMEWEHDGTSWVLDGIGWFEEIIVEDMED